MSKVEATCIRCEEKISANDKERLFSKQIEHIRSCHPGFKHPGQGNGESVKSVNDEMLTLDSKICPCQEEYLHHKKEQGAKLHYESDKFAFVETLVEVKPYRYYKRKREEKTEDTMGFSSMSSGVSIPVTYRGTKAVKSQFPKADYVCPLCEAQYTKDVEVRLREVIDS